MMKTEISRRSALMQAGAGIAAIFVGVTPICASPDCVAAVEHLVGPVLDGCISTVPELTNRCEITIAFDAARFSAETQQVIAEFGPKQVLWALENMPRVTRSLVLSYGG